MSDLLVRSVDDDSRFRLLYALRVASNPCGLPPGEKSQKRLHVSEGGGELPGKNFLVEVRIS
jgi:hypothetical protein